jgi:hypothetical protein
VGAQAQEDDGKPFEEKMQRLKGNLSEQFLESARLEAEIRASLSYMRAFAEAYPSEEIVPQLAGQIHMRAFYEAYPDEAIMQQLAAQIPWFHNCILQDRAKSRRSASDTSARTSPRGWSRYVLVHQIESDL